ncbi:MAG TPA: hypothetical protein VFS43_24925 [Polyangiaceae bacterium]|nr:hypothetical protein [Polyangiaceae bacterium]
MKYHALALAPAAWVAAFLVGYSIAHDPVGGGFVRAEAEAVKAIELAGCALAMRAFSRGDYLRRAWGMLAGCSALLLARDAVALWSAQRSGAGALLADAPYEALRTALTLFANLLSVAGTFMLARAWRVAGLELRGTPLTRAVVMALWVAISAAVVGPAVLGDARRAFGGDWSALRWLATDVGDLLALCLMAPVLFTALTLRGGLLRWPWGFLATGLFFWLLYDAARLMGPWLGLSAGQTLALEESFRAAGCLYGFAAGAAQALALRERAG